MRRGYDYSACIRICEGSAQASMLPLSKRSCRNHRTHPEAATVCGPSLGLGLGLLACVIALRVAASGGSKGLGPFPPATAEVFRPAGEVPRKTEGLPQNTAASTSSLIYRQNHEATACTVSRCWQPMHGIVQATRHRSAGHRGGRPKLDSSTPLQHCHFHNAASYESSMRQWLGTTPIHPELGRESLEGCTDLSDGWPARMVSLLKTTCNVRPAKGATPT